MKPETITDDDFRRLTTAEAALGRAARALYMIGSAEAVALGEAIEPILGKVQSALAACDKEQHAP